jgi:hypothetical protein
MLHTISFIFRKAHFRCRITRKKGFSVVKNSRRRGFGRIKNSTGFCYSAHKVSRTAFVCAENRKLKYSRINIKNADENRFTTSCRGMCIFCENSRGVINGAGGRKLKRNAQCRAIRLPVTAVLPVCTFLP